MCPSTTNLVIAQVRPQSKLWIAIGVAQPIYQLRETDRLQVSFVIVNDGDWIANPGIDSSHLFINGIEPKDWSFVISNGIRTSYFNALPAGKILSFGYQLGSRYFARPGIYTVFWQVGKVRSAEITFRVMPGKS